MGFGIGIGIGWPNASAGISYVKKLIKAFKERVLSYPTSIFEAEACLDATLTELNAIGLLKEASLVITPNAYNEGILYDVVPNTTLGDMTVVRATTATRVNEQGLIEVVPRNLLTYSEQFENAIWPKSAVSVTPNVIISPAGTMTADKLIETATTANHLINRTGILSFDGQITISCFAKKGERNWFRIQGQSTTLRANFDLENGVVGFVSSSVETTRIESIGDGWYFCSITSIPMSGTFGVQLFILDSNNSALGPSYLGDGTSGLFIWGAQLEEGSLTEYFPTTTRLNIPRIDYTNGSCPSLLVEGQRTNVATYSEQFDNAAWTKQASIITANSINSPAGSLNADTINEGTTNSVHRIISSGAATSNGTYTASVFIKKGTRRYAILGVVQALNEIFVVVDTDNFTITQTGANGTYTYVSNSIVQYSDGWFKLSLTGNILIGSVTTLALSDVGNPSSSVKTYTGNSSYIYAWGAQLEAGSYPTSYIPTVASSVTRNADVISKTGIADLIGQTEGVLFIDFEIQTSGQDMVVMNIYNGTTPANSMYFYLNSSNVLVAYVDNSGTQATISTGVLAQGKYKAALAYKANDCAFYLNGSLVGVDVSNTIPTCNALRLENYAGTPIYQEKTAIHQALLFKTRLSNVELASLTTL